MRRARAGPLYLNIAVSSNSASHQVRRGAIVNALGTVGKISGPTFLVLVSRLYGPDVWGIYATSYAVVQMVSALLTAGLADGTIMYVANDVDKPDDRTGTYRSISTALFVGISASLLVLVGLFVGGDRLLADRFEFGDRLILLLRWMCVGLPMMAFERIVLAATQGLGIMKYQAIVGGATRPLSLLATATAFWFFLPGELGLAVAFVVSQIVVLVTSVVFFGREFSWTELIHTMGRFRFHRGLLRFTIPQSVNATFDRFTTNVDVLMLGLLGATATMTGFYSAGALIVRELRQIKLVFSTALSPQIARLFADGKRDELSDVLTTTSRWIASMAVPACIAVAIHRNDLLWIVNSAYADFDAAFVLFLLPVPYLRCSLGLAGNVVVMTGRPKINLANGTSEGVVNVLLNLWLIPMYGLVGAALASSLSAVVRGGMELFEIQVLIGVRFVFGKMYAPHAAGLVSLVACTVLLLATGLSATLTGRLTLTLAAVAIFAFTMRTISVEGGRYWPRLLRKD